MWIQVIPQLPKSYLKEEKKMVSYSGTIFILFCKALCVQSSAIRLPVRSIKWGKWGGVPRVLNIMGPNNKKAISGEKISGHFLWLIGEIFMITAMVLQKVWPLDHPSYKTEIWLWVWHRGLKNI